MTIEPVRSIPQMALDVHMTAIGSYVRSEEDQARDVAELKRRLSSWCRSVLSRTARFDAAVYLLASEAVREHEESM
jgi:hypothetical protein